MSAGLAGTAARQAPARRGVSDALPVLLAYVPFGLTIGAAMTRTGLPGPVAWSSSPLLFGGAAQLVAVQLLGAGASAGVVVLAALVVNARLLLYGASLAPHVAAWPRRWRWAGAYLLADPVYALAATRFDGDDGGGPRERLAYYLGSGVTLWVGWQALTGLGTVLGGALPSGLRLDVAAGLTFLLLLLPMLTDRGTYVAAAVGGITAVAASGLPLGLGVPAGAVAGVAAGVLVRGRHG